MVLPITRREMTLGLSVLLGQGVSTAAQAAVPSFDEIERRYGGRLGVFALDTGTGRTLSHRADELFLLCSSFKMLLVAMVLSRVDHGQDELSRIVRYGRDALLPHAPVAAAHLPANRTQGAMTIEALCGAAVQVSDNTAANLLLARIGGPAALTGFLRGIGDPVTRLDRFELALNTRDGLKDTTTPRAIVATARTILLGDVLSAASRASLEGWMTRNTTGLHRLRASFPVGWGAADKTGTGPRGETNDIALARPPARPPLVMAAYYDPPDQASDNGEAVQRAAGSVITAWADAGKG